MSNDNNCCSKNQIKYDDDFVVSDNVANKSAIIFCNDYNDLSGHQIKSDLIGFNNRVKQDTSKLLAKILFFSNQRTTIYRLPSDLYLLNEMTPIEYLKRFTVDMQFRRKHLKIVFNRYKFEESLIRLSSSNDIIYKDGLFCSLQELSLNLIKSNHFNDFISFLDLNTAKEFDFAEFIALIAFAEIFFMEFFYGSYHGFLNDLNFMVESADFSYLFARPDTHLINKQLLRLLRFIADKKKIKEVS